MRVAIHGSPKWVRKDVIMNVLKALSPTLLIEGGRIGAERIAYQCAKELQIPTKTFNAQWDIYHSKAGIVQREEIIQEGRPEVVIVFCSDISRYLSVQRMIARAKKYYIPVKCYNYKGEEYEA